MTLLDELKAARDLDLERIGAAGLARSPRTASAGGAWSTAISIVERYLEPMKGLDPHSLAGLADAYPCLPGERHTFDAGAKVCLCGSLSVGLVQEHPQVCLYTPTANEHREDLIAALAAARLWLVGDYVGLPREQFSAEAWTLLVDRVGAAVSGQPGWMHTARTFRSLGPGSDGL
jgi:hypothetical protein